MRPIILLGGIHDGLELEVRPEIRNLVLHGFRTPKLEDLFFPEERYPSIEEDLVTYSNTDMKNKDGRWIFQII